MLERPHVQLLELLADDVQHISVFLESTLHDYEGRELYDLGVLLHQEARHDDVDESPFVLEQQEDRSVGARRTLTDRHQPSDEDLFAAAQLLESFAVHHSCSSQSLAHVLHRMSTQAHAGREIILVDQLGLAQLPRLVHVMSRRRERKRVTHRAQSLPSSSAAVGLPRSERSRAREVQYIVAPELRPQDDICYRGERPIGDGGRVLRKRRKSLECLSLSGPPAPTFSNARSYSDCCLPPASEPQCIEGLLTKTSYMPPTYP